jgi:hypothetical protein
MYRIVFENLTGTQWTDVFSNEEAMRTRVNELLQSELIRGPIQIYTLTATAQLPVQEPVYTPVVRQTSETASSTCCTKTNRSSRNRS